MRGRLLTTYFALAYAISWAFWAPAVLAHIGWIGPVPSRQLHLAGGLGPMAAAIAVTGLVGGRPEFARLGRRCLIGGRWLFIAVLIPAALFFVATAVAAAFYREAIDWTSIGRSNELPELPRPVYWLANLVFYGFGEEVGWRGFALPRLQARGTAFRASLLLALGWAGWHLPLFAFSPGLSGLGLAGSIGWLFSLCLGSVLLTWLFNASGGSIGAVALFHAALDVFITSPVAPALPNVMGALLTIGTIVLIPVFGRENLSRRPRVVPDP
jgi:membrane protease YdiL (CAAX protease family)